jgi:hypothetical protein
MLIRNALFVGNIDFMKAVFNDMGKTPYIVPTDSLYEIMTLEQALEEFENGERFFIKPVSHKQFSASVIDEHVVHSLKHEDPNSLCILQEVFPSKIVSEWRIYVLQNRVEDIKCYAGDFTALPDFRYAEQLRESHQEMPIAYVHDVALLENGETRTVEYNDFWAIGNYGIDNGTYLDMLQQRYFEILRM